MFMWTTNAAAGTTGLLTGQQNSNTVMGRVRESDTGTYTCQASIFGSSESDSITLTVTGMLY